MALELERNALVWGITGNLGGGKSLTAVYFMVNAISSGYAVVTNITLNVDLLVSRFGAWARDLYFHVDLSDETIDPFKFPCGDKRGSGGSRRVLCVFDECAEWFDQYANAKSPHIQRLWSWLRHSSKRSQDVFLIVQRPDYLHKVLRILVARWLQVNDLAVWRVPLLRMRLPFMGGFVVSSPYDRTGIRVGHAHFIRKAKWGRFYDTAECLNNDGAAYSTPYEVHRVVKASRFPLYFWLVSILALLSLFVN